MIVEAAAAVFDELGYEGASTTEILARSGVTRGALYFHFPSKEAIADAVVAAQAEALVPPQHKVRLQSTIDLTMDYAHRLRHDAVARAAVRLSVEQASYRRPGITPYQGPGEVIRHLLRQAAEKGELLASADPDEVTDLIVGAFTGIQLLSHVYGKRRDLPHRVAALWKYLLPALAIPGLLPHLVADPERGTAAYSARPLAGPAFPALDEVLDHGTLDHEALEADVLATEALDTRPPVREPRRSGPVARARALP
ncbi:FarA [Streptantibioticus cattleyicolor NRRL 8057 = DSM 46488]|uniref:FarA n=1 Tax=Streptantibioticus cattleyicolor (strain ATCC 35852 / DSM 46488 / JCM 4925 / NBRC 14057 / NRRL 8057) TaxID=1003195 RepID=G8X2A1_STREN|nr:FarA [Streptantibioticus cattleyicolor NRRL 8057 = DSM 46488]MYS59176.1 TetR family transcriptional regulator [Streptomyces sp. SID5468]